MSLNTLIMMAREDAAAADLETPVGVASAEEIQDVIDTQESMNEAEAQIEGSDQAEALAEEIQEEVDANNELIESGVEPTDVQVAVAEERFKAFAKSACLSQKLSTESFTFLPGAKMSSFSLESYSYTSKSNRDRFIETNMAMESIVKNMKDIAQKAWKAIKEFFINLYNRIKNFFSGKKKVAQEATNLFASSENVTKFTNYFKEYKEKINTDSKIFIAFNKLYNAAAIENPKLQAKAPSEIVNLAPEMCKKIIRAAEELVTNAQNPDFEGKLVAIGIEGAFAGTKVDDVMANKYHGDVNKFVGDFSGIAKYLPGLGKMAEAIHTDVINKVNPLLETITKNIDKENVKEGDSVRLSRYKAGQKIIKALTDISDALHAILLFAIDIVKKYDKLQAEKEAKSGKK